MTSDRSSSSKLLTAQFSFYSQAQTPFHVRSLHKSEAWTSQHFAPWLTTTCRKLTTSSAMLDRIAKRWMVPNVETYRDPGFAFAMKRAG